MTPHVPVTRQSMPPTVDIQCFCIVFPLNKHGHYTVRTRKRTTVLKYAGSRLPARGNEGLQYACSAHEGAPTVVVGAPSSLVS